MARQKVAPEDLQKRRPITISDKEWQEFQEAANKAGHKISPLIRDLMKAFIEGRFTPYPHPEQ